MILQRYIFRELVLAFLLIFVPIMFISLIGMLFQMLKLIPANAFNIFLQAIPVAAAYMAHWVMGMSTCAATTLIYGRMAAENEIDAMIVSGVHPRKLFTPALMFAVFLCAGSFLLSAYGTPQARHHRRVLMRKTVLFLLQSPPQGNQSFKLWGKYTLSYVNSEDGVLERPFVVEKISDDLRRESFAKSGRFLFRENEPPMIVLVNGEMWDHTPTGQHRVSGQGDVRISFDIGDLNERSQVAQEYSMKELLAGAARIREERRGNLTGDDDDVVRYKELMAEYYARFARGAAPLFLISLCAAIGVFVRKGSRLAGLGASMPPFLAFVVLELSFNSLGSHGKLPPILAAWGPNLILAAASGALWWKVVRR